MTLVPVLKGLATYIPGLYRPHRGSTGGTVSARYCYSVWLRHLSMIRARRPEADLRVVAELGPGDSLGLGLAALLSGASRYYGFDIVPYTRNDRNVQVLHELVELLRRREPIPGDEEFPEIKPRLQDYRFPAALLPEERLERLLAPERIARIEQALGHLSPGGEDGIEIRYFAPWQSSEILLESTVDFLFSQAVLEHIDDLEGTYRTMFRWLKPGAIMSHQIDFRAHHLDRRWNAHWSYSDLTWRLIRGRRPYLLNRQPLSTHLASLERAGFGMVQTLRHERPPAVPRHRLARRFRDLSDQDLGTSGVFLIAEKRRTP